MTPAQQDDTMRRITRHCAVKFAIDAKVRRGYLTRKEGVEKSKAELQKLRDYLKGLE